MASAELRGTFEQFREQCIWIRTCFNTNKDLFDSSETCKDLLRKSAPLFFGELNRILYEYYVLQVCKLTDPAFTTVKGIRRFNLTVAHVNDLLIAEGLMTLDIETASVGLMNYRTEILELARNRQISHSDKETVMTFVEHGKHTRQEADAFLNYLQAYSDGVGNAVGIGPLDFSTTSGAGDVLDLFKALNGGEYPR